MITNTTPAFPAEVMAHILTSHDILTDEEELKRLCLINTTFCAIVQPQLFRNINLRTVEEAIQFLSILKSSSRLESALRILQISFNLDPEDFVDAEELSDGQEDSDEEDGTEFTGSADEDEHEEEDEDEEEEDDETPSRPRPLTSSRVSFWKLWGQCLDRLQVLHTITICYHPEDVEFLWRFRDEAQVRRLRALRCLHLAYLSDCHPDPSRVIEPHQPDVGPWNSPYWAQALCSTAFCHVRNIIVMAPVNPMWPPTKANMDELVENWLGQLPPMSHLQRLVLLCGYENEGNRAQEYCEAWRDGPEEPADPSNPYLGLADEKPVSGFEVDHGEGNGWPPGESMSYQLPAVVWNRHNFKWSEGSEDEQYCRLGEYRFFNPMFETGHRVPARLCGFSGDLFHHWPGTW
ncbi:hypothetical protein B0H16DRAFT_1744932 [Mycena metata]|uniref:Uncharacterized protein n=1 Tax=Mycena metata TaxID=1033252 RepID=A0AAD7H4G0_9AGAR|nr:hypothetical protein B0H16DRAFT_1744932 [Mycena metata]